MMPLLLAGFLSAGCSVLFAQDAAGQSPALPVDLLCEGRANPLGIDEQPSALSWHMEDDRRGARQTAWRVVGASEVEALETGKGLLWDSGKVVSDQSQWVPWGGPKLESGQRVFWKVMIWDADQHPTAWSEPAIFEMGLLKPSDWQARWIQGPESALQVEGEAMEFVFRHLFLDGPRNSIKFKDDLGGGRIPEAQALVRERVHPATIFRREFVLDSAPRAARLYLCGLGKYQVSINGRKVDTGRGGPSLTHYTLGSYYQTLDVSEFLNPGANAIAVTVVLGRYNEIHKPYGDHPCLIAQLQMRMPDGKEAVVGTGPEWKMSADGPLVGSQHNMVEMFDARRDGGFSKPGFDDAKWAQAPVMPEAPTAQLRGEVVPSSRCLETIKPESTRSLAPGVNLLDFGRMISGHVRLCVKGAKPGVPVVIRYYETLWPWDNYPPAKLPAPERNEWVSFTTFPHYDAYDGPVQKGLPIMRRRGSGAHVNGHASIAQTDAYITGGRGEESWEAPFSCNAFRYAEIIVPPGVEAKVEAVGVVTHTDAPVLGSFQSSSPLYERIWRAGLASGLYNLQDGTAHDNFYERMSYLTVPGNHGNMMNFDMQAVLRRQLMGVRWWVAAGMNDGKPIGTMVDSLRFVDFHKGPFKAVSMSEARFFVEMPYYHYLYYGDPRVPLAMRSASEDFLRFWSEDPAVLKDGGFFRADPWGDHIDNGTQRGITSKNRRHLMPPELYHAATLGQLFGQYLALAKTLGFEGEPEARWAAGKEAEVREAINLRYFDAKKGAYGNDEMVTVQAANALPLAWGIAPDGAEASMVNAIADDIGKWNGHQSTGWRVTRELFDVFSRHGHIDLAARLMSRTEFPSFGKMVESGSGTLHEYWGLPNSPFPARGSFMQNEGNTAACAWFPQALAGIRPSLDGPGVKRFTVEPHLPSDLDHAEFRYRSPHGEIVSGWRKEGAATRFTVEVPPNTQCDFFLPATPKASITESGKPLDQAPLVAIKNRTDDRIHLELPAGRYEFLVEPGAP